MKDLQDHFEILFSNFKIASNFIIIA